MAVITISRQVAALGDEIAEAAAKELGYTFIDRKQIEKRIVELGFPKEKLPRYDERKPGFFASLAKDRDEYLNYLQLAVLEAASTNNCILIGRGSFIILNELPHEVSFRFITSDKIRLERLQNEFNWNEKQAQARIDESDANRAGFHKSFFNLTNENPDHFDAVLNTGALSIEEAVAMIKTLVKARVTSKKETEGTEKIKYLLEGQRLVNRMLFDFKINVNFLQAVVSKDTVVLQGVADSMTSVEKAVQTAAKILPSYKVESAITVVQEFKAYP